MATKKASATTDASARSTPSSRGAQKSAAKKSATKSSRTNGSRRSRSTTAKAESLVVREDESPWTPAELDEVRGAIEADVQRLQAEIQLAEHELVDLMRNGGDGAGDDQADAGAKTFEREQEITLANNARDMLVQSLHAIERLDDGTYGICESCGNAIGKLRLQAAPRATLCVPCKTKEERR